VVLELGTALEHFVFWAVVVHMCAASRLAFGGFAGNNKWFVAHKPAHHQPPAAVL
jgi:hypothetical protein